MRPLILFLAVFPVLGATSCGDTGEQGFARAVQIASLDEAIGGPKASARPGDFLLENELIRVAILAGTAEDGSERHSTGPGTYGGSLVDADLQWADPRLRSGNGLDQFAELIPTANLDVTKTGGVDSVRVIADGSDGGPAIIRAQGQREPFLTLLTALWGLVGAPTYYLSTDYILEPGEPFVRVRTTVTYGHDGSLDPADGEDMGYSDEGLPLLTWAVENGVVGGDFYLSGGSVDVFAPELGFDEDSAVYAAQREGQNTFTAPFAFDFVAGTADGVSYGIASSEGKVYVPLFTSSQTVVVDAGREGDGTRARFAPGTSLSFERYFFVGKGDIGSIVDGYVQARELPHGQVTGFVTDTRFGEGVSGVDVLVYKPGALAPWSQWRTDVSRLDTSPDGSFGGALPVGTWEVAVHDRGRAPTERQTVEVTEGQTIALDLKVSPPSTLYFEVVDEANEPVPAKVTLFRLDRKTNRNSMLGDSFIAGDPEAVLFPMYGSGEVELEPGTYQAVASRGLEYEVDVSEPFVVTASSSAELLLQVVRSVESEGWISADLHVHARPSHDSGVELTDRVRTMVCEGVEFFSSTDHDFVTDYAPVVEQLGLERWVQTAVGNEVTTIEVGHFLGFPLVPDFLGEAGGAMDWTGSTPAEMLGWIRQSGVNGGFEPVTFVGHPRDGILGYFDQFGFDPYSGIPGQRGLPGTATLLQPLLSATNPLLASSNISWDFDGLEMLNGKRFELIRTPTQRELDRYANGDPIDIYQFMTRTMEEQDALQDDVYRLGFGIEGQVDDWFSLLNLGYRYTVLGNSDTHGLTSTEAGCPRNFVMTGVDDPAFLDDQAVADVVKAHRVVASYGPFVRFWLDGAGIGDEIIPETPGAPMSLSIEVQAPTWVVVDRVEVYENGTLIAEFDVPDTGDALRFMETIEVTPSKDSWYVVMAMGDGDLAPVFTPVEIPYIELQMVVTEALGGIDAVSNLLSPAVPIPREFPVKPFAITNPIWVDLAGDGFDAPGLPSWLRRPVEPAN